VGVGAVLILGIAIACTLFYLKWRSEQKRRSLLIQWATANNWTFVASDDSWCNRWNGDPFGAGDHRRARNVLTGQWQGRAFASFDYSYQTHSSNGKGGQNTETHYFAVSAVSLPTFLRSCRSRRRISSRDSATRSG